MTDKELAKLPENLPEDFNNLKPYEQQLSVLWITKNLIPIKSKNRMLSSYYLKHIMERENGLYLTNGQFKGAMRAAGFEAFDTDEINWNYCVKVEVNKDE